MEIYTHKPEPKLIDFFSMVLAKEEQPFEILLFDNSIYEKYKNHELFPNIPFESWRSFNNGGIFRGANLLDRGQIEIWKNKKRIKTYTFNSLLTENLLFPIFNSSSEDLKNINKLDNAFLIGVQEKGHLGKYKIEASTFNPDELRLHLINFTIQNKPIKLLHKITYQNIELNSLIHDTLITGTYFSWV